MPRTNKQLKDDLTRLTLGRMGFDGSRVEQGSDNWHAMRFGVITASRAKDLIAKGEMRKTYMAELMAQVEIAEIKDGGWKQTEWGHEHEGSCVGLLGFELGEAVEQIPFVYADDSMRYGCSPDGLVGDLSGVEAKCPFDPAVFNKFVAWGDIKPEYIAQVQFSMFVTDRETWHFACYHPKVTNYMLHSQLIERDEKMMATFSDAIPAFIHEMDQRLAKLDYTFGDQWPHPIVMRKAA
jgi:hypothetical protein